MPVAVHTRQTAHLPAVPGSGAGALQPANYQDRFGSYYETFVRDGNVRFRRSYYASPPFAWEVQVTADGDASQPWAYVLPWRRIVLLFTKAGADTYVSFSDDGGQTFETPTLMISGGTQPFGGVSPFDGTELIAAFIAASGKIQAKRRYAGAAAYEASFFFKDDSGVDMVFEDDTFAFWWGYEGAARIMLHAHIDGESATSTWWSGDDGQTFTRFV